MGCTTSSSPVPCSTTEMVERLRIALKTSAEALEPGKPVVITGPCRPAVDAPLLSPLTGRPCLSFGIGAKELIWYTHRIGSKVEDRERWESRFSNTQQSDFYIDFEGIGIRVRLRPREFVFGGNPVTTTVEVKPRQTHPPGVKVIPMYEQFCALTLPPVPFYPCEFRVLNGALEVRGDDCIRRGRAYRARGGRGGGR